MAGVLSALILLPAALAAYFLAGLAPIHSDAGPSALESAVLGFAVRASVRRHATQSGSIPAANDQTVVAGGKLYMQGCAGCHGELGKPFHEDRANFPPVPQFKIVGTRYSQTEIAWVIKHGIRMTAMSAYGRFYSEEQLSQLAAFVKASSQLSKSTVDLILEKDHRTAPLTSIDALPRVLSWRFDGPQGTFGRRASYDEVQAPQEA
jgi:mono/diheme cytochrome c family protein